MAGGAYQVRSLSFVSCMLNMGAIRGRRRLPISAFFLWNDDFEYTTALLRNGVGYYVPASEVVHKTKKFGSSDADPGQRFYNEVRNKIWMLRFCRSDFSFGGLLSFLAKTARRWLLTVMRAGDRPSFSSACATAGVTAGTPNRSRMPRSSPVHARRWCPTSSASPFRFLQISLGSALWLRLPASSETCSSR